MGLMLGGCYSGYYGRASVKTPAAVSVAVAPPAPLLETPTPRPAYGLSWQAGYWDWRGSRYDWVPGRWTAPPRPGVVFVPPQWQQTPYGWQRQPGRWVAGQELDAYGRQVWYDALGRKHYF